MSIGASERERKGEKGGVGEEQVAVMAVESKGDILSKGWRSGRRGRQTQVEHAAHIIALACASHRCPLAGRRPVHC